MLCLLEVCFVLCGFNVSAKEEKPPQFLEAAEKLFVRSHAFFFTEVFAYYSCSFKCKQSKTP